MEKRNSDSTAGRGWTEREMNLRQVIIDIWWMARRYADGRASYATSMYNSAMKRAIENGVFDGVPYIEGPWALDRMGRAYDGLTDEEAAANRSLGGSRT